MAALWLLNFDAELEWSAARRGSNYAPSKAVAAKMKLLAAEGCGLLLPGDQVLDPRGDTLAEPQDWIGRAFCPTPFARRRFRELGVPMEAWPDLAIVEAVNDRGFALAAGLAPEKARMFASLTAIRSFLDARGAREDWLAKRALSTAGKGQRPLRSDSLGPDDRAWLRASLTQGQVLLEPRRQIRQEFSLHGWLGREGTCLVGVPLALDNIQRAFGSARVAQQGELTRGEESLMRAALDSSAMALAAAGYFGPFGIDAYRWGPSSGRGHFEPCSEINARYTLAWAIGMQAQRERILGPG